MAFPSTARPSARSEATTPLASGKTAPLLRGRFASKGSGENPEGDPPRPGMRRCSPCGNAGHAPTARPSAARSEAPAPFASRKNGPAFAGPFCVKGRRRESGGRPLSPPGMRRSSPCGNAGHAIDGARPPPGQKRLCPLQAEKTAPFLRGRIASKGSGEDPEGALSLPRVCAEAAPAPGKRGHCSGPRPGMRRSSPCGNAGHAIDGAPIRRQVGSKRAPCKRQNGPAFAGSFCVKRKRRGSGGRSPSPGRWTRPAPASRPGRRRSRPGGHLRRQSR